MVHGKLHAHLGLARTICIRCIYGINGREITRYTLIYGVYIRFWPTLCTPLGGEPGFVKLVPLWQSPHTLHTLIKMCIYIYIYIYRYICTGI